MKYPVVIIILFLLIAVKVEATDRYVAASCSGQPTPCYTTAQAASNAAVAGDTVYFRAGSYAAFTVANSGTLGNPITFRNYNNETVTITGSPPDCGTGDGTSMICVNAVNYITINGLILHGSGTSTSGIQISHASFINLLNSEIRYAGQTGVAIYYADTHDILVQNNVWHDNVQANIEQSGSFRQGACTRPITGSGCDWGAGFNAGYNTYNINVIDNVAYFNHGEALTISGFNSVVRGNMVTDNWSANLYCTACYNTLYERNFIYVTPDFAAYPLMPGWSTNKVVYEGLSISSGDPGVHDLTGIVVANNILGGGINRWQYGTVFSDNGNQILNNTLITNPGEQGNAGIWWKNPGGTVSNLVVRNNLIHRTANGSGGGAIQLNNISSATVSNNIYYDTTGTALTYNAVTYSSLASWAAASGDSNSLVANPLLVNASATPCRLWVDPRGGLGAPCSIATARAQAANYALQATSPAKDHGFNLGTPYNTDYTGATRTVPWDIGAYESGVIITPPTPQLVLALPLDEGSGLTAVDVSGQKNNATRVGGAAWDNNGKYGKAIMFDGTGYLTIPTAPSLALSPAMTLESWIYPTASANGQTFTVIWKNNYYLYGSSAAGYCGSPVGSPLGGYATTTGQSGHWLCASAGSLPPLNQWTHLAVTFDGNSTLTFYLNGNPVGLLPSSDPMEPSGEDLNIGGNIRWGEYFTGKIDEVRVYNYARTPDQIVSDMNTPLIGAPGKVVEIAAPASVEISSASSLEISAD